MSFLHYGFMTQGSRIYGTRFCIRTLWHRAASSEVQSLQAQLSCDGHCESDGRNPHLKQELRTWLGL